MVNILIVKDKSKRELYLTHERYKHIIKHPEMQNKLEDIRNALRNPLRIVDYALDDKIKYYYRYYKDRKSKAKYLRISIRPKYLDIDVCKSIETGVKLAVCERGVS